eukprot:8783365-Pyramimonas_sp.AAC.1
MANANARGIRGKWEYNHWGCGWLVAGPICLAHLVDRLLEWRAGWLRGKPPPCPRGIVFENSKLLCADVAYHMRSRGAQWT